MNYYESLENLEKEMFPCMLHTEWCVAFKTHHRFNRMLPVKVSLVFIYLSLQLFQTVTISKSYLYPFK